MGEELDLPDEVYGFGSWLLWVLATRATEVVDRAYAAGPARPSRHYGTVDGHPVPTPSLVAWLLTAAQSGLPPDQLAGRDPRLDERQKVLRTVVSRAVGGEPRLFKDAWLRDLAAVCGLGDAELDLLFRCRDDEGYPVDPPALRQAISRTLRSRPAAGHEMAGGRPAGQVVAGEFPREPPGFVAREMLGRLAEAAGRGPVAVVCAVTGLRGVGKTHLAAAYARARVADGWGLVGWVNAETEGTLLADLARIADRLGVADPEGDSAESARRLREHLQVRAQEGLLVLDNATAPDQVRLYLPATGGTQTVITSTDQAFAEFGELVEVAQFSRAESVAYLDARTGLGDPAGADAVAAELGDLPLALAQAAATIRRQHLSYPKYLERLGRASAAALLRSVPGGDYPDSAAAALLLSIQTTEASDSSGLTSQLLRVMAALSPDGVGRAVLDGLAGSDSAIERCAAGSLLTWSVAGDAVIMHRLLARILRERDQAEGRWEDTVSAALDLLEPVLLSEEEAWARREEGAHLASQAEALWDAVNLTSAVSAGTSLRLLRVRCWAVRQLCAAADLSRAVDLGTRVLADCTQALGAGHVDTVTARNDLAHAWAAAGQMDRAIPLFEQTVTDREQVLGPGHPGTFSSQRQLGGAYQEAGRLGEAIALYERTLHGCGEVLGSDHPDTLSVRDALADAYETAGRLHEAIPLYEQTLADRERVLGADHPDTLTSQEHLAGAYETAGRLAEAISLYERNLANRERALGTDHPAVLESRTDLAYTYQSAGRLDQAIPLYERALADHERVLGSDHPGTLVTRSNLAFAYRTAGRLDRAIEMMEQSLADHERIMGDASIQSLRILGNLGDAYALAGRLGEAIPLLEKTLTERQRILGADHPHTLAAQDRLAFAYASAGRMGEAVALQEIALSDCQRIMGSDHPRTLFSQDHLADIYGQAGRSSEAIALFEKTLADRERILGADHPDTAASRDHLERARRPAR